MADSKAPPGSVTEKLITTLRGRFPGLVLISGYRKGSITVSGKVSRHSKAQAVDIPPDPTVFNWIRDNYGSVSHELIFSPMGSRQIYAGKPHVYTGAVKATHYDHIHWSMDEDKAAALGGVGATPVSNPTTGIDIPGTSLDDKFDALVGLKDFFAERNGVRRLAMIVVGAGMVVVGVNLAYGRKISGVVSGAIGG